MLVLAENAALPHSLPRHHASPLPALYSMPYVRWQRRHVMHTVCLPSQLCQQGLRLLQIRRVKALGEPG
jgi:hypothetical protein